MKINIQKAVKCLSVLLVVIAITLTALSPDAHAAAQMPVVYHPWEYLTHTVVDGDIKTVTFKIPTENPLTAYFADDSWLGNVAGNGPLISVEEDFTSLVCRSFAFGGGYSNMNDAVNGNVLCISDVSLGAQIHITGSYVFQFEVYTSPLTVKAVTYLYKYDADGNWAGVVGGGEETVEWNGGGHFTKVFDFDVNMMITSGDVYILPVVMVYCTSKYPTASAPARYGVSFNDGWTFTTDINMIYENSMMMQSVKDELGDLNDKTDQIISGGEAGDSLNDALAPSSPFGDASDNLGDAMDDFEDSSSKLPSTPDKVPSGDSGIPTGPPPKDPSDVTGPAPTGPAAPEDPTAANPDSVEDYVDIAGNFFDWEASGLTYMYAPMVLSVTLAILFYTVFGKA